MSYIQKILAAEIAPSNDPTDRDVARFVDFKNEDEADAAQEEWERSSPRRRCGVLDMHDQTSGVVSRLFYERPRRDVEPATPSEQSHWARELGGRTE